MPSIPHELTGDIFARRPSLVIDLLRPHIEISITKDVRLEISDPSSISTDLPDWRADKMVLVRSGQKIIHVVIVETQLRPSSDKPYRWPQYQTIARGRHEAPTLLLVICADEATARWAAKPIRLDTVGSVTVPVAVGPTQMPRVTDPDEARELPLLAALSLIGHPHDAQVRAAAVAASVSLFEESPIKAAVYDDFISTRLDVRARKLWEDHVLTASGYRFETKFFRDLVEQGKAEGKAEGLAMGKAEAILRVLEVHGVALTSDDRERILSCTDPQTLDVWLGRAVDAKKIGEVFG